jgi:hypothetical protein
MDTSRPKFPYPQIENSLESPQVEAAAYGCLVAVLLLPFCLIRIALRG